MKLSKTLIPALILLVSSGWTMAEEESVETLPRFSQVDTDQNGGISKTEASQVPGLVEAFAQVDINADGWLNQDEYRAVEQASSGGET
ncbi:MAG: EF-hand domain-containing protein [Gammaproteobacteria bacterium]